MRIRTSFQRISRMTTNDPHHPVRASSPDIARGRIIPVEAPLPGAFLLSTGNGCLYREAAHLLSALQHYGLSGRRKNHMAKKPKIEHSELAGEFTDDGVTVLVDIHRTAGSQEDWVMEVISQDDGLTTWEEKFATDREAFDEFLATVERDGIRTFLEDADPQIH